MGTLITSQSWEPQLTVLEVWKGASEADCCTFLELKCAGCPEVGQELEAVGNNEEPDVPCHLPSCNEQAPDDEKEGDIKEVVNVSEPGDRQKQVRYWVSADLMAFSVSVFPQQSFE